MPMDSRIVLSVSQLNTRVRDVLEAEFSALWVEGEISNLIKASSGHYYFTLKDEQAQVRAALFRGNASHLGFIPNNGQRVLAHCRVSLYPARGDYQLIVDTLEPAGEGKLRLAFERLKQTLASEGLFDPRHKQKLPAHIERVGVVTSPTGAAIHDILTVFKRRFPAIEILLFPSQVQGEAAGRSIALAIQKANELACCDVLIVGRGGGSLEDLWAFNEEVVARAIFASKLPVVSAVGHEIDFSIADLVADVRAPTPSAAAELLSPDQTEVVSTFRQKERELIALMNRKIQHQRVTLNHFSKRLKHPRQALQEQNQRLDMLEIRLHKALQFMLAKQKSALEKSTALLQLNSPKLQVQAQQQHVNSLTHRLQAVIKQLLSRQHFALQSASSQLNTLSPLNTLARGYSIVTMVDKKARVLTDSHDVAPGDVLRTQLFQGQIFSRVISTQHQHVVNLEDHNE
ncbi:MAG TPA: exodeoxyribonuclease VII large subunit [Pseudomonadales bacterium]|nr:exodeoxyribonuclease VII large subunit [Pseudomonadales bacterium]